ncbi:MAG: hypothetical protein BMS9Abin33_0630 [Gammaproteobacteria bacterium]|nr:MAG: hypothetical protein BMS9Abin33_0630 [Gammaproteobacteria bacterium]
MNYKSLIALTGILFSSSVFAAGGNDPLLGMVMIDQLETRIGDGDDPAVLEAEAWVGKDLNKFWLKTDVESVSAETEELEVQALYSRAIAPYWDLQAGWRHDNKPEPNRDWLAIGFKGLAPYFFEVDTALFFGDEGRVALRLEAEYEILFTQKLILTPEIDLNFHSKNDKETGTGSGLSDLQTGLRLRYEFVREFAPYIGVNWNRKYGKTADYIKAASGEVDDTRFVAGIRAWF